MYMVNHLLFHQVDRARGNSVLYKFIIIFFSDTNIRKVHPLVKRAGNLVEMIHHPVNMGDNLVKMTKEPVDMIYLPVKMIGHHVKMIYQFVR